MHLHAVSNCLTVFAAAALQLPAIRSLLPAANEQPGGKAPRCSSKVLWWVIPRSNQCWAGLSCDFVIEQILMRSLKSTGGLTRGSGMTEDMRNLWTSSAPATSEYNIVMQDFTNLTYTTSLQHKDSTEARI